MTDKQILKETQRKFRKTFEGNDGEFVLGELYKFCGLLDEPFHSDPYKNAYEQGKRRVALHIAGVLGMDIEETAKLVAEYQKTRSYNVLRATRN